MIPVCMEEYHHATAGILQWLTLARSGTGQRSWRLEQTRWRVMWKEGIDDLRRLHPWRDQEEAVPGISAKEACHQGHHLALTGQSTYISTAGCLSERIKVLWSIFRACIGNSINIIALLSNKNFPGCTKV